MATRFFFPQTVANNNMYPLANGDLIDQMFNASLPWKLLKTLSSSEKELVNFSPKLDIMSDDKTYTINAELPGVDIDNVKLEVKNGLLILSGEKKKEFENKEQHIAERSWGSFQRELSLPDDADVDNINATHKDGVLSINIPKIVAKESVKNININRS